MGGVLIVLFIFISAKTLGRIGVKSYWACARLFPSPFEQGQGWANGAANSSPVKRPMDWAAPDDCAHDAADMCDDLLSSTYLWRISFQGRAASRFRINSIHKDHLSHLQATFYWTCGGFSPSTFEGCAVLKEGEDRSRSLWDPCPASTHHPVKIISAFIGKTILGEPRDDEPRRAAWLHVITGSYHRDETMPLASTTAHRYFPAVEESRTSLKFKLAGWIWMARCRVLTAA